MVYGIFFAARVVLIPWLIYVNILRAIHDGTSSKVRFQGYERGLREGCPSSPILFNIYHSGIIEVSAIADTAWP